jgi:enoyl-CoA hydratase/carnithine racemase
MRRQEALQRSTKVEVGNLRGTIIPRGEPVKPAGGGHVDNRRGGAYEQGVSTDPSEVVLRRDDRVATITLQRPHDQNRLTRSVLLALQAMVDELAGDEHVQTVVLTGAGADFFSMGILNPAVRASYSKPQILDLVRIANRLYDALEALPQIVIAALNGAARAGAAELSLACDIRLAASHTTWALPEALWGGFPGAGGPVRLPMLVGSARALELICTGRELDAAELERLGLVLAVHPGDRLLPEAQALAARIAASGPLATRGAKRIVRTRLFSGFGEARTLSDTLRHALEWSADVDEGMAAHREGRPPRFTGR